MIKRFRFFCDEDNDDYDDEDNDDADDDDDEDIGDAYDDEELSFLTITFKDLDADDDEEDDIVDEDVDEDDNSNKAFPRRFLSNLFNDLSNFDSCIFICCIGQAKV